jgi:hypothetical protein
MKSLLRTSSEDKKTNDRTTSNAKKLRLPDIFSRRIAAYAVAAGAAGVTLSAMASSKESAQGHIVFTPAHLFLYGIGTTHLSIDLNHDGITDFDMTVTNVRYYGEGSDFAGGTFWDRPIIGNSAILRPLAKGAVIGNSGVFDAGRARLAWGRDVGHSGHGSYSTGGPWAGNSPNQYLGVRFLIDGETHYGWIRMTVYTSVNEVSTTITGYAYNTVPNQSLKAGEGTEQPEAASTRPASLGLLAMGATGLLLWRKKES